MSSAVSLMAGLCHSCLAVQLFLQRVFGRVAQQSLHTMTVPSADSQCMDGHGQELINRLRINYCSMCIVVRSQRLKLSLSVNEKK